MRKTEIGEISGMMAKIQKRIKKLPKAPQEVKQFISPKMVGESCRSSEPGSQGFKVTHIKGSAERGAILVLLRSKESMKMDSEKRPIESNSDLKLNDGHPRNCMSDTRQKEEFFTPYNRMIE